jgi:hypothetical protein
MRQLLIRSMLSCSAVALSGCVASMAASAVSAVVSSARGSAQSNAPFQPTAAKACTEQASVYGAVHIIDVEQHGSGKIIVWGTVDDGKLRRAFECAYGTKITGFKLRTLNKGG